MTLLPVEEMVNFGSTLAWIKQPNHQVGLVFEFPVLHTFQPGPMRSDLIVAVLYRRKVTILKLPYTFFCLAYGNELFQSPPLRHVTGASRAIRGAWGRVR